MIDLRQFIDFTFRGRHRLEYIAKLPLGSTVADAIRIYGEPTEVKPSEDAPEIAQYIFAAGLYHEVVANEWQGRIQSITYWSTKADPGRDLDCMLDAYRETSEWHVQQKGYWYQRQDGQLRLWCSAIPAIGVAYVDFLNAKDKLKTAYLLSKLDELEDATWVPDDVVRELQSLNVVDGNDALVKFSKRSNSIAVSPDGTTVLIVRNHHAYDVPKGFMELNIPPKPGEGYSTQVINFFFWGPSGSSWGKATLPRDAEVTELLFSGDTCHVSIRQKKTDRLMKFASDARGIGRLQGISLGGPHDDANLWAALEEKQAELACERDE